MIKGRVGFEAAGAILTLKAHHLLEKHVLSKYQLLGFFYRYFCTHLQFFQKLVQIFYLNCLSLVQIVLHLKKQ